MGAGGAGGFDFDLPTYDFLGDAVQTRIGEIKKMIEDTLAEITTIVSGFLLAGKIGRQRFVCGLICGAFYALCLLAAAFLVHGVPSWTRSDAMLPLALLLGGTLGGAFSAIREGH